MVNVQLDILENHRYVILIGRGHLVTLYPAQALTVLLQGRMHDERRPDGGDHPVHGSPAQTRTGHHFPSGPHHRVQLDRLRARARRTDCADLLPGSCVSTYGGANNAHKKFSERETFPPCLKV